MFTVKFNFEEKDKHPITIEGAPVDDSILEIALKNGIDLHHNCGGVCGCSTCHIYLDSGDQYIEEISDKEEDFIDRARNPKINSRLSCQCVLLPGDGVIEVTVPDQSLLLGE
jgi:2Fe-2S ferredoxin